MPDNLFELTDQSLDQAKHILGAGGLVAIPTETVYGLAADASNDSAVAKIFSVKNRPHFNPLIAHFASFEQLATQVDLSADARQLGKHFWPGALTIVAPLKPGSRISALARDGGATMAVRLPGTLPKITSLLAHFECGLVAPSANISGKLSPTSAKHVAASLGGTVDLILDGGRCPIGIESTIVDMADERPKLLRHGGITQETLEHYLGPLDTELTPERIKAPGQLKNHYSPRKPIAMNKTGALDFGEGRLGFGVSESCTLNLSPTGDLIEAAANLFDFLDRLDRDPLIKTIGVCPIPHVGLGAAINDRLARSVAPKTKTALKQRA